MHLNLFFVVFHPDIFFSILHYLPFFLKKKKVIVVVVAVVVVVVHKLYWVHCILAYLSLITFLIILLSSFSRIQRYLVVNNQLLFIFKRLITWTVVSFYLNSMYPANLTNWICY